MSDPALEPFVLEPRETPAIWGGDALVRRYGKAGDPAQTLGESWECYDDNRVSGGRCAGQTLAALRARFGANLMGSLDAGAAFPVLTKIIDAHQALSVQVHPDDAYARRVEHQPNGKTECWIVLDAAPDATIVLGWAHGTSRAEYERRVADGSLGAMLRRVPVSAGDAFYLPAGTLHAIGAGVQIFETQQTSDLTYRIFDWNRVGADGKPRELHVAKAADVLDYRAGAAAQTQHLRYTVDGYGASAAIADPRFAVETLDVRAGTAATLRPDGVPLVLMAGDRALSLRWAAGTRDLAPWTTAVLPAGLDAVGLAPASDALAQAYLVTPDRAAFERRIERAGVPSTQRTAFLGQFELRTIPPEWNLPDFCRVVMSMRQKSDTEIGRMKQWK